METKRFYNRNLPHWQPEGVIFAVQFNLAGCLPPHIVEQLRRERKIKLGEVQSRREKLETQYPAGVPYELEAELLKAYYDAKISYERAFDDLLDKGKSGPTWLAQPKIATIVKDALHYAEEVLQRHRMLAYCIMPNHVHLITTEVHPILHQVLGTIKQYTSRLANQYLNRTGKRFWQSESYDHIIRNERELHNQIAYVLNNPVKANLVEDWQEWTFSYLAE